MSNYSLLPLAERMRNRCMQQFAFHSRLVLVYQPIGIAARTGYSVDPVYVGSRLSLNNTFMLASGVPLQLAAYDYSWRPLVMRSRQRTRKEVWY